jgi:hypothetical protein
MTYRTCTGCVHSSGFCQAREDVKATVKGIGVTSLKWKCKWKRPVYQPGDAVFVETIGYEPEGDEDVFIGSFPATVIQTKGSKLVCFIEPGVEDEIQGVPFEPKAHGNGHVKVPMIRVTKREGIRESVCEFCNRITRLVGHEDYCRDAPKEQRQAVEQEYYF